MKRLEHAPEQSCPLPYINIKLFGWSYVEQLERILEHYRGQTQKQIKDKHIKNRW